MKHFCLLLLLVLAGVKAAAAEPFIALDRQGARSLVEVKSHSAPTIIALWSSDCSHCKGNLKLFARMASANPRLRLITIAVEPLSEELAVPLDRLGVPGPRYAYGPESPDALAHALDPKWRGELPRTLLFDGNGGKETVSGVIDEPGVRRHLKLTAKP
jgi:thiol-disulfide isomerase/thioredoxin